MRPGAVTARASTTPCSSACARGAHVALGGIALPNAPSAALHEKLGFRQVAHYREVGWKFGRWIDVGYWQLTF